MAMSEGFGILFREKPEVAQAWLESDRTLTHHSALDAKTAELAYIAVLAALGLERGLAFHTGQAQQLGATRDEVFSATLVGLPAAGARVIEALAETLRPFAAPDAEAVGQVDQ